MELLRLLEPAVRPDGVSSRSQPVSAPIESRSFDSILTEARDLSQTFDLNQAGTTQTNDTAQVNQSQGAPESQRHEGVGALASLARVDRIENAALRQLISSAGGASRQNRTGTSEG